MLFVLRVVNKLFIMSVFKVVAEVEKALFRQLYLKRESLI